MRNNCFLFVVCLMVLATQGAASGQASVPVLTRVGEIERTLPGDVEDGLPFITGMAASPVAPFVALGLLNGHVAVYDGLQLNPVSSFQVAVDPAVASDPLVAARIGPHPQAIVAVKWCLDGSCLLAVGATGGFEVRAFPAGNLIVSGQIGRIVRTVDIDTTLGIMAFGLIPGRVAVASIHPFHVLAEHDVDDHHSVGSVAFSSQENRVWFHAEIASSSPSPATSFLGLWNTATDELEFTDPTWKSTPWIAVEPSGTTLVSNGVKSARFSFPGPVSASVDLSGSRPDWMTVAGETIAVSRSGDLLTASLVSQSKEDWLYMSNGPLTASSHLGAVIAATQNQQGAVKLGVFSIGVQPPPPPGSLLSPRLPAVATSTIGSIAELHTFKGVGKHLRTSASGALLAWDLSWRAVTFEYSGLNLVAAGSPNLEALKRPDLRRGIEPEVDISPSGNRWCAIDQSWDRVIMGDLQTGSILWTFSQDAVAFGWYPLWIRYVDDQRILASCSDHKLRILTALEATVIHAPASSLPTTFRTVYRGGMSSDFLILPAEWNGVGVPGEIPWNMAPVVVRIGVTTTVTEVPELELDPSHPQWGFWCNSGCWIVQGDEIPYLITLEGDARALGGEHPFTTAGYPAKEMHTEFHGLTSYPGVGGPAGLLVTASGLWRIEVDLLAGSLNAVQLESVGIAKILGLSPFDIRFVDTAPGHLFVSARNGALYAVEIP